MKKIIVILLLILFIVFQVSAATKESGETLKLSLTVTNVVYVGVAKTSVNSAVLPSESIKDVGFYFNSSTGKWEAEDVYIYIISYVTTPVTMTLTAPDNLTKTSGTGPDSLAFTYTVQYTGGTSKKGDSTPSSTTNGYVLYKEASGTQYTEPRAASWQFNVVIDPTNYDGNNNKTAISSDAVYQGTFTLTLKATS